MNLQRWPVILGIAIVVGCGGPPKDTQKATVEEPKTNATVTAVAPVPAVPTGPVKTYKATDASEFKWTGYKIIGQHSGTFIMFEGTAKIPGGNLEQAAFAFDAETLSTDTDDEQLTRVMKGKDFFDCDQYPNLTFQSTKIEKNGEDWWVSGELKLKGVTKSIRFPAKIGLTGDTLKLKSEFTVNRKWWNIIYQGLGDNVLKDDVLISLSVEAKEAK